MKFSESLKKNKDFQVVYKKGKSFGNKYLVMYVLPNELGKNRIGISVSKKVGNSIVRHHLTRLIRESYRLHEEQFLCGYDVVVIARTTAKDRTYHEVESALIHLGKLHNIYEVEKISDWSIVLVQHIKKMDMQKGIEDETDHVISYPIL